MIFCISHPILSQNHRANTAPNLFFPISPTFAGKTRPQPPHEHRANRFPQLLPQNLPGTRPKPPHEHRAEPVCPNFPPKICREPGRNHRTKPAPILTQNFPSKSGGQNGPHRAHVSKLPPQTFPKTRRHHAYTMAKYLRFL